jgi:predicted DCC family thiol-disulfide oxidoreductase YuxK
VQFVLQRDAGGQFVFAPLQSEAGRKLLAGREWNSVVLAEQGQVFEAEAAVLRILARLTGPWPIVARVLGWLPQLLLRWGYRIVARHRYTLFGRSEVCLMPRPEWKGRFLE